MTKSRRNQNRKNGGEKALFFFGDVFILCFFRVAKVLWAKTSFAETLKEGKLAFAYDSLTSLFVLGLLGWAGFWHFFSHQLFICWEIGGGIIALLVLSYFIGRFRRNRAKKDAEKDGTKEFKDEDLPDILTSMGFTKREVNLAIGYVNVKYPNETLENKVKFATQFAGNN